MLFFTRKPIFPPQAPRARSATIFLAGIQDSLYSDVTTAMVLFPGEYGLLKAAQGE